MDEAREGISYGAASIKTVRCMPVRFTCPVEYKGELLEAPAGATSHESVQSLERRLSLLFRHHPLSAAAATRHRSHCRRPGTGPVPTDADFL